MRFVSLFAGIGGIDLGLERAGMTCVGQVEWEAYPQAVLKKHWPDVPKIEDVRDFEGHEFGEFDLLAGGYPCQPFSVAGKRKGKDDIRHLWPEVHRIIRNVRPRFVLLENVTGHLTLGFGQVLGDLASCGYDAEWDCIPAAAVGAPHRRDRVFIIAKRREQELANANHNGFFAAKKHSSIGEGSDDSSARESLTVQFTGRGGEPRQMGSISKPTSAMANTAGKLSYGGDNYARERLESRPQRELGDDCGAQDVANTKRERLQEQGQPKQSCNTTTSDTRQTIESFNGRVRKIWAVEPDVGRVADGVPARVDRLRGLGNAVVPQVAQYIGERIMREYA